MHRSQISSNSFSDSDKKFTPSKPALVSILSLFTVFIYLSIKMQKLFQVNLWYQQHSVVEDLILLGKWQQIKIFRAHLGNHLLPPRWSLLQSFSETLDTYATHVTKLLLFFSIQCIWLTTMNGFETIFKRENDIVYPYYFSVCDQYVDLYHNLEFHQRSTSSQNHLIYLVSSCMLSFLRHTQSRKPLKWYIKQLESK